MNTLESPDDTSNFFFKITQRKTIERQHSGLEDGPKTLMREKEKIID